MNVRRMVESGAFFILAGKEIEGQKLLEMAYDYILRNNRDGRNDLFAICCHAMISRDGEILLVHCGEDDDHPLFPGTLEERKELCFACQKWCLERIAKLKEK